MKRILIAVSCLLPLVGEAAESAWSTEFPEWGVESDSALRVKDSNYFFVIDQYRTEAISNLKDKQIKRISEIEAKRLAGKRYSNPGSLKPFLVRGVYMHGADLLVMHLGSGEGETDFKQPLVINLPEKPFKIYVFAFAIYTWG